MRAPWSHTRPKRPSSAVRLLIDENISPIIGQALRAAGHDVIAAANECPGAPDDDVLTLAIREGRILVQRRQGFWQSCLPTWAAAARARSGPFARPFADGEGGATGRRAEG